MVAFDYKIISIDFVAGECLERHDFQLKGTRLLADKVQLRAPLELERCLAKQAHFGAVTKVGLEFDGIFLFSNILRKQLYN